MSGNNDWPIRGQYWPNLTNQSPVLWGVIESDDGSLSAEMSVSYLCSLTGLKCWLLWRSGQCVLRSSSGKKWQPWSNQSEVSIVTTDQSEAMTRGMGSECHNMDETIPTFCQLKQYLMLFAFNDWGNFHKDNTPGYFAFHSEERLLQVVLFRPAKCEEGLIWMERDEQDQ